LLPRFLYYLLCSYLLCSGITYADILLETRGSAGQSNISLTECREMLIPIPSLSEQSEIINRVERLLISQTTFSLEPSALRRACH